MKTQFRDPDGILNSLQNVISSNSDAIFFLLLEACESFDICMIRRNNVIKPEQKTALLDLASCPLSLRRQVRLYLQRKLGKRLLDTAQHFDMPQTLREFLLFEYSWSTRGRLPNYFVIQQFFPRTCQESRFYPSLGFEYHRNVSVGYIQISKQSYLLSLCLTNKN